MNASGRFNVHHCLKNGYNFRLIVGRCFGHECPERRKVNQAEFAQLGVSRLDNSQFRHADNVASVGDIYEMSMSPTDAALLRRP
jgi:hypothetical protein